MSARLDADASAAESGTTGQLGAWVAGLDFATLPSEVVFHLKLCLLDSIGCGLFGASQPWGRITAETAIEFSGGGIGAGKGASLLGRTDQVSPPDAALANGTAIHGFEIDDIHVASSLHPGAVAIPAALALGEARGISGRALLTAIAAGYEAGIRVGMCAGVSHSTSGFHVTGTVGAIAAAAAAARALDLAAEPSTHSLALGATQAGGLYAARFGAMAKRFHAGRAAQSGVLAATLAARGFTGADNAIEAPFGGFMSALSGQHAASTIVDDLGDRWETLRVGFKAYAACASAHTTIDAVGIMMLQGLTAEKLQSLTIRMSRKGATNVGWRYVPGEIISAQMNGFYAAAVKLVHGNASIDQYRQDMLADPRTLAAIERICIVHDPELDKGGAAKRHAVHATAELIDGRRLEAYVEQRRGSAEHPLPVAEIERKFERTASALLGAGAVEKLHTAIMRIDEAASLKRLCDLMSGRISA